MLADDIFQKKGMVMSLGDKVEAVCSKHGSYMAVIFAFGDSQMTTRCPMCVDERDAEDRATLVASQEGRRIASYLSDYPYMAIPARYSGQTLPTIEPTGEGQRKAISKLARAIHQTKSVILFGDGGAGKTHLLTATLATVSGVSCGYTTLQGMVSRVLDSMRDRRASVTSQRLAYTSPDLLVIDDVGAMPSAHRDVLDDVITARHADNRHVMIGTSLPPDSLKAVIGQRATRRLQEMGAICIFIA